MEIEKDLKIIGRVAREKEAENWEFRSFLKRHDFEIDKLVRFAHNWNDGTIIPFSGQIRKPQKTSIFSVGCRNSETLN